jgi:CubicO group peptidase (beta-lactamase class C family)
VDEIVRGGLDTVFPAAVLLVARHGGVVSHRAYGYLDPEERQRPTRTDSLFDLASVTKLFTATAFMTLVEADRVALDTSVVEMLPEFNGVRPIGPTEDPLAKTQMPPDPAFVGQEVDAGSVTFWHLLTHSSGLAAWRSLYRENGEEGEAVPMPHHVSAGKRARRMATIHRLYGFAYPPGTRMVYSDLGIILLGEAIARLAKTSLEAYVRCAVLEPLGLTHTTYNPLAHGIPREQIVPTELCAWRRRRCIGEVHDENAASLGGVAGHAGLFSTAEEVTALGQMYLNGGRYGSTRVLSPETVAEMTHVQVNFEDSPRGLGWLQRSQGWSSSGQFFGPRSYGHTGFTGTSLWVDPDRELVVTLMTNRVYYGRDPTGIADFRPRLHEAVVEAIR